MPKHFEYTSIERIFTKIERDYGITSFNEYDIVEWTGEALESIGVVTTQLEEALAFIEVENHQCLIPKGLNTILQIAKNRNHVDCFTTPSSIKHLVSTPVMLDCKGQATTDYEVAYYRPFFDFKAFYFNWTSSDYYNNNYVPVRLANNTFFNSLVAKETNENVNRLYNQTRDEYTIVQKKIFRFSFEKGQIAISYLRPVLDEEGYPMIPDLKSVTETICYYILWKMQSKEYYLGREGSQGRMKEAENQYMWYCKQAGNELIQPYGIDDYQDNLDMLKYLLPNKHRYFGFFGNLTKVENTQVFDDPNRRNGYRTRSLFRGYYG